MNRTVITSLLLLWGPYLWAEGTKGRQIDSLVWERTDFGADGVHPSDSGRQKVAELLLKVFTTDPLAKPWFTVAPSAPTSADAREEPSTILVDHVGFQTSITHENPEPPYLVAAWNVPPAASRLCRGR